MTLQETPVPGQHVELQIGGMTCASCANRIERKLNKLDGVLATVNYATEKAKVTLDAETAADTAALVAAVESAGYTAHVPRPAGSGEKTTGHPGGADGTDGTGAPDPTASLRQRLVTSAVLSVPVIALGMVPAWQFTFWQWLSLTLAAPVVVSGAGPSTRRPGPTCATARPPWTRWSRSAPWPPSAGRCTRSSWGPPARPG